MNRSKLIRERTFIINAMCKEQNMARKKTLRLKLLHINYKLARLERLEVEMHMDSLLNN